MWRSRQIAELWATLTVNNPKGKDSVYAGVISGALGNLTKQGAGALTLGGHNTYGGETIVQGGILRITDEDALGAPAAETLINPGAALELQGGINVPEALTLNGGTLRNANDNNTWDGRINLSANSAIESAKGTLTVNGRLRLQDLPVGNSAAAATRLSLAGRGQIILARAISGLGGLRKTGPGQPDAQRHEYVSRQDRDQRRSTDPQGRQCHSQYRGRHAGRCGQCQAHPAR